MKWALTILLIPHLLFGQERRNHFNIVLGGGLSYFFNDASLKRRVDNTRSFGFNYIISPRRSALSFNPGLVYQVNAYQSNLAPKLLVHVSQHTFRGTLDVLMKAGKKLQLRVGLFFDYTTDHFVEVSYTDYNARGYYSNSYYYLNYSPHTFQTGVNVGLSYLFKMFRREQKLSLKLAQHASSLVRSDFWMTKNQIGEDAKILSAKARPTMLIVALEINLKYMKKHRTEEQESHEN